MCEGADVCLFSPTDWRIAVRKASPVLREHDRGRSQNDPGSVFSNVPWSYALSPDRIRHYHLCEAASRSWFH